MQADEDGTLHILPEVLKKHMGNLADEVHWAAIVGPSIAGELAVHRDTCVVFCGEEQEVLDRLAAAYRTDYYHVWTSTDFIGHEVGACMKKNIFAFGGGFAAGMLDKAGQTDAKYVMYDYTAALFGEGARELKQMVASWAVTRRWRPAWAVSAICSLPRWADAMCVPEPMSVPECRSCRSVTSR